MAIWEINYNKGTYYPRLGIVVFVPVIKEQKLKARANKENGKGFLEMDGCISGLNEPHDRSWYVPFSFRPPRRWNVDKRNARNSILFFSLKFSCIETVLFR